LEQRLPGDWKHVSSAFSRREITKLWALFRNLTIGLHGSDMLRIRHIRENRHTDRVQVVSVTHRPSSNPQKHVFSFPFSGTRLC
jgi:hypothetical protein